MRTLARQQRLLALSGSTSLVLTLAALVVCLDALVLQEVGLLLQGCALVVGALALASLSLAAGRVITLTLASRRLVRTLPILPGPVVAGASIAVLDDAVPRAFCLGLLRPRVVVSQGALDALHGPRLEAVVAHERHHASRRDGLRRVLADGLSHSLVVLPVAAVARDRYDVLLELHADNAAARSPAGPSALAAALLALDAPGTGVEPERVDRLVDPTHVLAPVPGARRQAAAVLGALIVIVTALAAATGSTDLLLLQTGRAARVRYEAIVLVALTSAALLYGLRRWRVGAPAQRPVLAR